MLIQYSLALYDIQQGVVIRNVNTLDMYNHI